MQLNGTPGSSDSYAFTVRRNGADTAIACTVSGSASSCADASNSAVFAADDTISIKVTPTGNPSGRRMGWTGKFVPAP